MVLVCQAEKAGEMDDKDFIRLEAERAEFERAKERLTLKHRNTSQWARRALKRGVNLHNDDGEGSCETASNTKTSNTLLLHRSSSKALYFSQCNVPARNPLTPI